MMDHRTDLFLNLTPEKVLEAVEAAGIRTRPVCMALNSFENRVYDVQLDEHESRRDPDTGEPIEGPPRHVVAKFYRPGRWSREQILEEHRLMADLVDDEIPICAHEPFPDGSTLKEIDGILYCLYRRFGGRAPDELTDDHAERLGMLVARMHNAGARREAPTRLRLDADTYVRRNLAWMLDHDVIPEAVRARYIAAAGAIADLADELMAGSPTHRVHGDLHLGNLILRNEWFHMLDFDDMVVAPPVQDLWLLLPGRDPHTRFLRDVFVEAYEQIRDFDAGTLRLIEPLRGLRLVRYTAWLARRWHDPIFPLTWPEFGTSRYWQEAAEDLEEAMTNAQADLRDPNEAAPNTEPEVTNADLFWDWEDIEKEKGGG